MKQTDIEESLKRKIDLVLSVSGTGNDQVNVLINTLAHISLMHDLEMANVINGLTQAYLANRHVYEDRDDDDEY